MHDSNDTDMVKLPPVLDLGGGRRLSRYTAEPACRTSLPASMRRPSRRLRCRACRSSWRRCEHTSAFRSSALRGFVSAFHDLGLIAASVCQTTWPMSDAGGVPRTGRRSPQIQAPSAATAPCRRRKHPMTKRILTIDDSKTIRDMLMLTLADAGFEVLQAVDGQDGARRARQRAGRRRHHRHQHAEDGRLRGHPSVPRQFGAQDDADPRADDRKRNRKAKSGARGRRDRLDGEAVRPGTAGRDDQQGRARKRLGMREEAAWRAWTN